MENRGEGSEPIPICPALQALTSCPGFVLGAGLSAAVGRRCASEASGPALLEPSSGVGPSR